MTSPSLRANARLRRSVLVLVLGTLLVVACGVPRDPVQPAPPAPLAFGAGPPPATTSLVGEGGAWCWFSDPRSVYHAGKYRRTYTSWITGKGAIVISSFDHDTRELDQLELVSGFAINDHNNPSLLLHADGRIQAFWSGHNGGAIFTRTMRRAEDLHSFGALATVAATVPGDRVLTYTNPVRLSGEGNKIYLFWRSHYTHQAFSTSSDGGVTWSPARVWLDQPHARPYVKYATDGVGAIAMAFTDGHPDERPTSLYYASYFQGRLRGADGRDIQALGEDPMSPSSGDLLWDAAASGVRAWVWDVALDEAGLPTVVFATFPAPGDHRYHYARFDGSRWNVQELVAAGGSIDTDGLQPSYSAGLSLDHEDPSVLWVSRDVTGSGIAEIERWSTSDVGRSWAVEEITSGSKQTNVRPITPRGLPADMGQQVLWMHGDYPHFTTYDTDILGG